jgi:hypothetical protein
MGDKPQLFHFGVLQGCMGESLQKEKNAKNGKAKPSGCDASRLFAGNIAKTAREESRKGLFRCAISEVTDTERGAIRC